MPKPIDGEVLPPGEPGSQREYNRKDIKAVEFLQATYRCEQLPMSVRIEAARNAAPFESPRLAQTTQDVTAGITIHISGGLPNLPGTNIIMPDVDKPASKANGKDPTSQTEK